MPSPEKFIKMNYFQTNKNCISSSNKSAMKIIMRNSNGEFIEIPIKDQSACRRMQLENGIKSDFTNSPQAVNQTIYSVIPALSGNNKRSKASIKANLTSEKRKLELDNDENSNLQINFLELSNFETLENNEALITDRGVDHSDVPDGVNISEKNETNELTEYLPSTDIEIMEEYQSRGSKELDFEKEVPEELNLIATNDLSSPLCRLCANESEEMLCIFGSTQIEKDIAEKINKYLPIKVQKSDTFPKNICHSCLEKLDLIHNFCKTVSYSEEIFLKAEDNHFKKFSTPQRAEKRSADFVIYTPPAKKFSNTLDIEFIDSREILYSETINEDKFEVIENEVKVEDNSEAFNILSEVVYENEFETIEGNEVQVKDNPDGLKVLNKTLDDFQEELSNEASEVSSNISELIRCRICNAKFYGMRKCYLHSASHSSTNYYPCSLCKSDSPSLEKWREHFTKHSTRKLHERRVLNYECEICKKKHVSEARLKFHLQFHEPGVRPCYCEKCDKFLPSESVLYNHSVMVHMKFREFCCDICGSVFRSQQQLDVHQRKHKNERPYECYICSKRFLSMDCLRRHRKLHLPDKPLQCEECGKRFDRTNSLTKHLLTHQVEAKQSIICLVCNMCNEVFFNASETESHLKICPVLGDDSVKIEEKNLHAVYRCEFCQRCYTSIDFVKNHRNSHSGPTPYVCTICNVAYATYNQVTAHKSAHRKSVPDLQSKEITTITKFFFCEYCEKEFLHFTNMNIHRRSCARAKNWTCYCCSSVFSSQFELRKHKRRKEPGEDWVCDNCERTFDNFCGLISHKEIHTKAQDRKLFKCSYCGKDFQQKAHLTVHIRSHTGEKPFACDLCDKAYSIKCDRDYHRRTHTGERPFKCTMCDKAFTNPARLREHILNHSDNRPYPCHICDQRFKKSNARKVHMLIHTGEKPYQCDICGINFRRSGDMRKHKKTRHASKLQVDKTS